MVIAPVRVKRGTNAALTQTGVTPDPTLLKSGEAAFSLDTNELRIGNLEGSTVRFDQIPPIGKPRSGTSLPEYAALNDLFFKSDTKVMYIWNGTAWEVSGGSGSGDVSAPATTTENKVPQWDSTQKKLKDGLVVGTAANNLLQLDGTGKVPSGNLPAAVTGAMTFKGVIDCSANPNYPAGTIGDIYKVSSNTGKIGGASGLSVELGDVILCTTTAVTGDHATVGTNWTVLQTNLDGSQLTTAYDHSQVSHAPSTAQANADITKAEIEAKLIGEISSHTHAGGTGGIAEAPSNNKVYGRKNADWVEVTSGSGSSTVGGVVGYDWVTRGIEGVVYETTFIRWIAPSPGVVDAATISLDVQPTGQDFLVDIRKNGVMPTNSIFLNDTPMSITPSQAAVNDTFTTFTTTNLDPAQVTLAAGDVLYMVIVQVGSTFQGADFIGQIGVKFTNLYSISSSNTTWTQTTDTQTLPATPVAGETIYEYVGTGNNWVLTANSGQYIRILSTESSNGGTVGSTSGFDSISLIYIGTISGHNTWLVKNYMGANLVVA